MRLWHKYFFPSLLRTNFRDCHIPPCLFYIKACLMVPFLLVTVSLFKQSTDYTVKSNNFVFLVCPIPRHWEKQDDRKAQKVGNVNAVTLSEGSVGKYFGLPISVTLSWVHLCQKSSELSAACQASKRFFEKILLHIPRKSDRYNRHCRHKHSSFKTTFCSFPNHSLTCSYFYPIFA